MSNLHGVDVTMLGEEISLEELKAIGQHDVDNPLILDFPNWTPPPAIPFGYLNDHWNAMLREYKEGDKFHSYSTRSEDAWKNLAGQSGYCLVRGEEVIAVMCMMRT